MFCTKCGRAFAASDNFCAGCGAPRPGGSVEAALPFPEARGDWRDTDDYSVVLSHPEVRDLVKSATGAEPGAMSAEDFFKFAEPVMKAAGAGGVNLKLIVDIAQPMYAKMGVKTGSEFRQGYASSFGRTLAAVLCSLASRNQRLKSIDEGKDGCVLTVELPSNVWAYKSSMHLTLARVVEGTLLTGAVVVPGAMYDWGHSKRTLSALDGDIIRFRKLQG